MICLIEGDNVDGIGLKVASDLEGGVMPVSMEALWASASILQKPLQIAYKNRLYLDHALVITAEHSKSKNLYLYLDPAFVQQRICLVDDEITNGRPFVDAIHKLSAVGHQVTATVASIEHCSAPGRQLLLQHGCPLYSAVVIPPLQES